jgi:hypothetical protein
MCKSTQNPNFKSLFILIILILLVLLPAISFATVSVTPHWGPPQYAPPYEPGNKPPDMDPGEDADAQPNTSSPQFGGSSGVFDDPNYQIDIVKINVTGYTRIREPNNCDPNLHAHELGHDALNKHEWEKNAKKKIEKELKDFGKKKFKGEGATAKARKKDARKKAFAELKRLLNVALQKIFAQMKVINDEYDKLTHRNGDPTLIAWAIEKAKKNVDDGAGAGAGAGGKNKNVKHRETGKLQPGSGIGGIISDPCSLSKLTLDPPITLSDANCSGEIGDTIEGRGIVDFNGLMTIGKMENGVIEMTDTTLRITDAFDPCVVLLTAYIIDPQYRPSSNPAYQSMIQGYLSIPLAPAECVNNVIASVWLEEMQLAAEANEYLSFWFYTADELYDENSNWLHGPGSVPGELVLGIGMEVFDEIDRFDDYNDITFVSAWNLNGSGLLELNDSYGHMSNKSMQLSVDTNVPPHYSEAVHIFTPPADWSGPDKKSLEVWIDSNECSPEAQDNIYIHVGDSNGIVYTYKPDMPLIFEDIWLDDSLLGEWSGINIDLRNLQEQGLILNSISSISIGVEDPMMVDFVGTVYIDDIRIWDTRTLGDNKFDFNSDGIVNFIDFSEFAENWMIDENWP